MGCFLMEVVMNPSRRDVALQNHHPPVHVAPIEDATADGCEREYHEGVMVLL